jgi:FdrA protein
MIEPATRDAPLAQALADKTIGVVLLDVILGWGSHLDPAGEVARAIASRPAGGPAIVASVTGTEADPQVRSIQVDKLIDAGIVVAPSNAAATTIALQCVRQ